MLARAASVALASLAALSLLGLAACGADHPASQSTQSLRQVPKDQVKEDPPGVPLTKLINPPAEPPRLQLLYRSGTTTHRQTGSLYRGKWLDGGRLQDFVRPLTWPQHAARDAPPNRARLVVGTAVRPRNLTVQIFEGPLRSGRPAGSPVLSVDCWLQQFDREQECRLTEVANGGALQLRLPIIDSEKQIYASAYFAWAEGRGTHDGGVDKAFASWLFAI